MLYYGDSSCNPHPAAPPNTWSMSSLGKHQASLVLQHPFSYLKTVPEVWTIFWQHHVLKECRSLDWGSALPTSRSTDCLVEGWLSTSFSNTDSRPLHLDAEYGGNTFFKLYRDSVSSGKLLVDYQWFWFVFYLAPFHLKTLTHIILIYQYFWIFLSILEKITNN